MKRLEYIDTLRGFSMLVIILIHATSYFLDDAIAYFFWNAGQFAVAAFIFCSFYLFFKKPLGDTKEYLKKRFIRLYKPYAIFLAFFIPLQYLRDPETFGFDSLIRLFTLTTGGNDLSWLVLLFLQLTMVGAIIKMIEQKSKMLFYGYFFFALIAAIFFMFESITVNFKLFMWIPWSLMIYFTWYFDRHENNKKILLSIFAVTLALFIFSYMIIADSSLYANKYPPNIYHITYGILGTLLLIYLAKKNFFNLPVIKGTLDFLSRYSYPLYFIHFLILYYIVQFQPVLLGRLQWWGFFIILLIGSMTIQKGVTFLTHTRST